MPGFNIPIDNAKAKHFLCVICLLLLRAPVQTTCGHRCCLSCVKDKRGSGHTFTCPQDHTEVTEVFPDRFVEREILNLGCRCPFTENGCAWAGLVKEFEDHVNGCQYSNVTCPIDGCGELVSRANLDNHMYKECRYRSEKCNNCDEYVKLSEKKKHHQTKCPGAKIKCSHCGKDVFRGQLETHIERECDEVPMPCPFTTIGCAAKRPMKKNDKRKHMENAQLNHITYLLNFASDLSQKVSSLQMMPKTGNDGVIDLMEVDISEFPAQNVTYFPSAQASPKRIGKVVSDSQPQGAAKFSSLPITTAGQSAASQDMYTSISDEITALKLHFDDMFERVNRSFDALRDSVRRLETKFATFEDLQQKTVINMADLNDKIDDLESATYSGTLVWAISNFTKKRHDSIVGKNVSFYSPYFYTGPYGYKMRLRVYLNGDGMGKGSHISLFFVVCQGKYDALLPWPFKRTVTLTILDQNRVKDVTDSFKPDQASSSFQRPKNPMNIASGCPLFMPLSLLDTQAYVKDDTLYIKGEVDMSMC